jgi:prepilin-type processing-associated H-X9-DG protein
MEGTTAFNAFNFAGNDRYENIGIQTGQFRYGGAANLTVSYMHINAYLCPSDPNNLNLPGGAGWAITCHNYVVNFGNTIVQQSPFYLWNNVKVPFLGAPFSDVGAPDADITSGQQQAAATATVGFQGIPDGLSNTLMTSEILVGQGWNLHGFSWWGYAPEFTGLNPPNSSQPDVMQFKSYCSAANSNPQGVLCTGATGSQSSGGTYTGLGMVNVPRSKHPGGVNAGMCDGSVRFFKNSVNVYTFQALSSAKGNEVISADSY